MSWPVRLERDAQAQLGGDGAHRRLFHAAQRETQIIELPGRGREQEIALVARRIDCAMQLRSGRADHPADIMAGGEAVGAEIPRQREQVRELDAHVAADAGNRRAPGHIFVGKPGDHRVAEAAFIIKDIMRDAESIGDRAGVANILPGAAAAGAANGGAMIVELERHADGLGAGARGQRGDHARIDAAGHGDDDAAGAQGAFKLEKSVHLSRI